MVSPISFAGTYKVNNQNRYAFSRFQNYALSKEFEDGVTTILNDQMIKNRRKGRFEYIAEQTLIVPDRMDMEVEAFCINNGINYKKFSTYELLHPKAISARIAPAPNGYTKVLVDTAKLENLIKKQSGNIEHCRSDYDKYYTRDVNAMLRSGDKISATTLYIDSARSCYTFGSDANNLLKRFVKFYGVEQLNNNQVGIDFVQKTDSPDHCVYFALKKMGFDKIPMYVDKQSYEAGKILGLF